MISTEAWLTKGCTVDSTQTPGINVLFLQCLVKNFWLSPLFMTFLHVLPVYV